ncbi:hypothetical protein JW935_05970 [candidate division KSB1 bacterium]|nr:hypothetical protein [candidate division KSB1 bacterium]
MSGQENLAIKEQSGNTVVLTPSTIRRRTYQVTANISPEYSVLKPLYVSGYDLVGFQTSTIYIKINGVYVRRGQKLHSDPSGIVGVILAESVAGVNPFLTLEGLQVNCIFGQGTVANFNGSGQCNLWLHFERLNPPPSIRPFEMAIIKMTVTVTERNL